MLMTFTSHLDFCQKLTKDFYRKPTFLQQMYCRPGPSTGCPITINRNQLYSMFIWSTFFVSRQYLERQGLRLNINTCRLLQIPGCVLSILYSLSVWTPQFVINDYAITITEKHNHSQIVNCRNRPFSANQDQEKPTTQMHVKYA